jgi:cytoskeletal protein CcmA (bactofilin family)
VSRSATTLTLALTAGLFLVAPPAHAGCLTTCWLERLVPAANAQETMEFEPVPEESVRAMERRATRRASPATPAAPEAPAAPARRAPLNRSGDVMRIGSDIHVEKDQVVEGDVFALQGDVRVDGHVRGNVASTGGDVYLSSTARVDGDVLCVGGELHEEEGAIVGGQRVTALRGDQDRRVRRRMREHMASSVAQEVAGRVAKLVGSIVWLLILMGIAWGVTRIAPRHTGTAVATLKREPGMSFMIGLLTAVLLAPSAVALALVMAILAITIIGIPLAIGVALAYCVLLVVLAGWGSIVAVTLIGQRFLARSAARRLALGGAPAGVAATTSVVGDPTTGGASLTRAAVIGVLLFVGVKVVASFFQLVPFLNWFGTFLSVVWWIANSLLILLGAGALLRSKFGQGPEGQWWPMRKPTVLAPAPAGPPPPPPASPPPPQPPPPPAAAPSPPTA